MKSSMPFPPNPESSVEELKRLHLHCNVWLNAIKVDSSAELETTSFDFSTFIYPEESTNRYTQVMNLNEKVIFP